MFNNVLFGNLSSTAKNKCVSYSLRRYCSQTLSQLLEEKRRQQLEPKKSSPKREPQNNNQNENENNDDNNKIYSVYSWGENRLGQLGLGDDRGRPTPTLIEQLKDKFPVQIMSGLSHTGVITNDGDIFTWGENFYMQVGHEYQARDRMLLLDDREMLPGNLHIPQFKNFEKEKQLSLGYWHSSLLVFNRTTESQEVYLWGNGFHDQLAQDGVIINQIYPVLMNTSCIPSPIKSVQCGALHSTLLTNNGEVFCWGNNQANQLGQLGDENPTSLGHPKKVPGFQGVNVTNIACGAFHSIAICDKGNIYEWGGDRIYPTHRSRIEPYHLRNQGLIVQSVTKIFDGVKVSKICAGNGFSAFLTEDGHVFVWKRGEKPKIVESLETEKIVSIKTGLDHIAAITQYGSLFIWAVNEETKIVEKKGVFAKAWNSLFNVEVVVEDSDYPFTSTLTPELVDIGILQEKKVVDVALGRDFVSVITTN